MPPEDIDMEYQDQMNEEERELEEQMKDWVRVVRCKDCKHYKVYCEVFGEGLICKELHKRTEPTDFCSYGERKDD